MCHTAQNRTESGLATTTANNLPGENLHVLNIGLGCGFTAQALTNAKNIDTVEIMEINDVVIEANPKYFGAFNDHLLENQKVVLHEKNGAEFLRTNTSQFFDAIVIDIEEPRIIQSSPIYTVEYAEFVEQQLHPDGIFALWAIRGNSHEYNQILFNTLNAVFDYVYIKHTDAVQLFASNRPLNIISDSKEHWSETTTEINTVDNRALEKIFNIDEVFNLPEGYEDRFIQKSQT